VSSYSGQLTCSRRAGRDRLVLTPPGKPAVSSDNFATWPTISRPSPIPGRRSRCPAQPVIVYRTSRDRACRDLGSLEAARAHAPSRRQNPALTADLDTMSGPATTHDHADLASSLRSRSELHLGLSPVEAALAAGYSGSSAISPETLGSAADANQLPPMPHADGPAQWRPVKINCSSSSMNVPTAARVPGATLVFYEPARALRRDVGNPERPHRSCWYLVSIRPQTCRATCANDDFDGDTVQLRTGP